jgi:hypothetical protein
MKDLKPETFKIDGEITQFFGNLTGSTEVKFNRVAMIANEYKNIVDKLYKILEKNPGRPTTKEYNCAVGLLLVLQTGIRSGNLGSSDGYMTVPMPGSKIKSKFVKTYGLTTLLPKHISFSKGLAHFDFLGKKHVQNTFSFPKHLSDLIKVVLANKISPVFNITDREFTRFIKDKISVKYSSKDFRTFRANWFAYQSIKELPKPKTKKEYKQAIQKVAEYVSHYLNNTPNVCKKSYIDPNLFNYKFGDIESFKDGGKLPIYILKYLIYNNAK